MSSATPAQPRQHRSNRTPARRRPLTAHTNRRRLFEQLEARHLLAVTLGVDVPTIAEAGGVATVTASLSAAATQDVTVELGLSGTGTVGTDYEASATAIVIPTGEQTGTATITAIQDTGDEPDESVIIDIANVVGDIEDGEQQVSIVIQDDDIASSVVPAPIAPDGNVANAATDLVINLDRSLDPSVEGRSLLKGRTIRVTLPDDFVNTNSVPFATIFGSTTCTPGNVQCSTAILVEGWPQNPVAPFVPPRPEGEGTPLYSTTLEGNTIVYTALEDLVPGTPSFGPGIKQLHLLLRGFTNPAAGFYTLQVEAETGPEGALETGSVQVEILAEQRPAISVASVFNAGNPNTIYQTGPAGGQLPLPYDFLLWNSDGLPMTNVTLEMVDETRALLRQGDDTIGEVLIESPAGATGNLLSSRSPSAEINAPVSGIPTARLTVDFQIGSAPGDYVLTFNLNGGNSQKMFVNATATTGIVDSVVPAPIAPDGNVANAATDVVINLDRSLDPSVEGRSLLKGRTIRVTLPDDFVNTNSVPFATIFGSTTCTPGNVQCSTAILVEGWPQNPVAPFVPPRPEGEGTPLYSTTLEGNTIVYTALEDLVPGTPSFGPGIKQLHLLLRGFTNPAAGFYTLQVEAETGPEGALETGSVQVEILAEQRPAISVASVFNAGNPNTIYQTGPAGGQLPLPYDFLLWNSDGLPMTNVTLEMVDETRAVLRQGEATIGEVLIESPAGATGNLLSSRSPSAEINAPVSGIPTARLTVDFQIGSALGDYVLTFNLNGGNSQKMFVNAINTSPVLTDLGRPTAGENQDTLEVTLEATDGNPADTLTFTATPRTGEYYLDQTIGLNFSGDFFLDFGGLGEKWLISDSGVWHYITPDGNFYEWLGGGVLNRLWLAQLPTATFDDPSLLFDAQPDAAAPATATVASNTLTLDPTDGFVGTFGVEVTVSDGENADTQFVPVDIVSNQAPVLADPGDQRFPTTQDTLDVTLEAADSTGDPITFTASVETVEYYFDQTLNLEIVDNNLFLNWSGTENEKWVLGDNGLTWYFLTPDGSFWRWLGGGRDIASNAELVAVLSPATYTDPALLYDAQPGVAVPATASVDGNTLTLNPDAGFVGSFAVMVTATDSGGLTDTQLIRVEVTPPAPAAQGAPQFDSRAQESRGSTGDDEGQRQELRLGFRSEDQFDASQEPRVTVRSSRASGSDVDSVLEEVLDDGLYAETISEVTAELLQIPR